MTKHVAEIEGFEKTKADWLRTGPPYLTSSDLCMQPGDTVTLEDNSQIFKVIRCTNAQEYSRKFPEIALTQRDVYFYEVQAMD